MPVPPTEKVIPSRHYTPGIHLEPQSTNDSDASDADDVETFRRIHVVPCHDDFLQALIELGQKLRALVKEYSKATLADVTPFQKRYGDMIADMIADLNVLRDGNLSPLIEIARRTPNYTVSTRLALEAYTNVTAQFLLQVASANTLPQADDLINWLTRMRKNVIPVVVDGPERVNHPLGAPLMESLLITRQRLGRGVSVITLTLASTCLTLEDKSDCNG